MDGIIFRFPGSWSGRPVLGAETVASRLTIGTFGGILMGNFLNNGGGSWAMRSAVSRVSPGTAWSFSFSRARTAAGSLTVLAGWK